MDELIEDQREIAHWIKRQSGCLRIAVAFWGLGAVSQLGLDKYKGQVQVLLDLSAGATNPKEVRTLMDCLGSNVRVVDRLHAKVWIGTDQVLLGSANASANGLGLEGNESKHWCELGAVLSNRSVVEQAQSWFDRLWDGKNCRKISEADLRQAQTRWEERRRQRPIEKGSGSLLRAAMTDPDRFRDQRCYVAVVSAELSKPGQKELTQREMDTKVECFAYENWRSIPLNAMIIAFSNYEGDGLQIDHPPFYSTGNQVLPGRLQFVFEKADVLGFRMDRIDEWIFRLEVFARRYPKKWNGGDTYIELLDFVEKTNS